jgi:putative AlgH/UPF0301 family transcriptional regulator
MIPQPGQLLLSHDTSQEPGLWFVFYADDEGIVAFDLAHEHPDIGYARFIPMLKFEDKNPVTEKIVLLGGPERSDDALIILHETQAATEDSNIIDNEFSFLSYTYVLVPGSPPQIMTPDNKPSDIRLKKASRFLIAMGYRIFDTPNMLRELKESSWIFLPATPDIIFDTAPHQRRERFLNKLN